MSTLARDSMRLAAEFAIGEHWVHAAAHLALAEVQARRGDDRTAEELVVRALELSRRGAGPAALAATLVRLAEIRRDQGDPHGDGPGRRGAGTIAGCPDPGLAREMLRRWDAGRIAAGRAGDELTGRELDVLRLMATPASQREIAADLFLSRNTVKTHAAAIFRKMSVNDRAGAIAAARARGIL